MTKTPTTYYWIPSKVIEETLSDYVSMGVLAAKEVIHWRVPSHECPPEPQEGEVIVFTDHLLRGFSPPGSKFF